MEYKAYSFDLDDNLLRLPTLIYLKDENGGVKEFSTSEFEKIRSNLGKLGLRISKDSFEGFRDNEQFIVDINNSVKAGSWRNLEKCIVKHASIFAIITARGHSPLTIRKGLRQAIINNISDEQLEIFVQNFLSKYNIEIDDKSVENVLDVYLDLCKFYPVSDEGIKNKFGSEDISELKFLAFEDFRGYVTKYIKEFFGEDTTVKIGFSDDSSSHLNKMVNNILAKEGLFFYRTDSEGKKKHYGG